MLEDEEHEKLIKQITEVTRMVENCLEMLKADGSRFYTDKLLFSFTRIQRALQSSLIEITIGGLEGDFADG